MSKDELKPIQPTFVEQYSVQPLEVVLRPRGTSYTPTPAPQPTTADRGGKELLTIIGGLALAVLIGGVLWDGSNAAEAERAAEAAREAQAQAAQLQNQITTIQQAVCPTP